MYLQSYPARRVGVGDRRSEQKQALARLDTGHTPLTDPSLTRLAR